MPDADLLARSWAEGPWIHAATWHEHEALRAAPSHLAELARSYHDDGYVVLRGAAPRALVDAARAALEPVFDGAGRWVGRLTDAWRTIGPVRDLARLPEVLELLAFLYDRRPVPFQTLSFREGTQQRAHSDAIHFDSVPPLFMCGVWVALEDVGGDQGPLFTHAGSHHLPPLRAHDLGMGPGRFDYTAYEDAIERRMRAEGLEPARFAATAGDVLVWSANLVHGGAPVDRPGATRWSQVTHYVFEGCVPFTPMHSDLPAGRLALRLPLVDISTGRRVPHRLGGSPVRYLHHRDGTSTVRPAARGGRAAAIASGLRRGERELRVSIEAARLRLRGRPFLR